MTTKELIKSFIDQALLFKTEDKVTIWIGVATWIVMVLLAGNLYLLVKFIKSLI